MSRNRSLRRVRRLKTFLYFACLLASLDTVAQQESGTLIVLNSSEDEIVVAADSRSYRGRIQMNDRCKITALGDQLIFAASGTTGNAGFKGIAPWDAHTIARDVFRKYAAKRRQQPMFSSISQEWAKRVKNHIKVEVKKYRNEVLPWIIGNSFISAVFAGFYNGSPYITIAAVTYDVSEDGKGKVQSSITKTITKPTSVMLGRNEIADELFAGKTERAQEWRKSLTPVTTDDGYAFAAIKAVEFSIENYPLVNIKGEMLPPLGGPVDAVRLRRTGGIDWIQKKENCPAN